MKTTAMSTKIYRVVSVIAIIILAVLFAFPLYWIVTGSFKTAQEINATSPAWWPSEWVLTSSLQKEFRGR